MASHYERSYFPKPKDFQPDPIFPDGHKKAGKPRCTAWSTHNGRQCFESPVVGKTKCYRHGGATPSGIASVHFKHGRYLDTIPKRLVPRFQESLSDTELLGLRAEISLIDARLEELIAKIDTGESGAIWKLLKAKETEYEELVFRARYADEKGKPELLAKAANAQNSIKQLINQGMEDYEAWNDIRTCIHDRKALVESERKRLVEMQQMLDSEQAMTLATALAMAVKNNVSDPIILQKINAEFNRFLHRPDQSNPDP